MTWASCLAGWSFKWTVEDVHIALACLHPRSHYEKAASLTLQHDHVPTFHQLAESIACACNIVIVGFIDFEVWKQARDLEILDASEHEVDVSGVLEILRTANEELAVADAIQPHLENASYKTRLHWNGFAAGFKPSHYSIVLHHCRFW